MLTQIVTSPYFDVADAGGSGGPGPGMAGPTNGGANVPAVDTSTPTPIALTDDSLISIPGSKEPIKYGEWKARYVDKSEFTKKTQEYSKNIAARDQQWKDYVASLQRNPNPSNQNPNPNNPNSSFQSDLQALANKPYVSGAEAVKVISQIVDKGLGPMMAEQTKRDQIIKLLYDKLQGVEGTAKELKSGTTQAEQKAVFAAAKESAKLPTDPVVEEFLQDIYLSHVGSDLNAEFPRMVNERWSALVKAVRAWDKNQAQSARQGGMVRGGQAVPSKPLKRGFETAEDIAKAWFPTFGETT